jgi:hypothetical protein
VTVRSIPQPAGRVAARVVTSTSLSPAPAQLPHYDVQNVTVTKEGRHRTIEDYCDAYTLEYQILRASPRPPAGKSPVFYFPRTHKLATLIINMRSM